MSSIHHYLYAATGDTLEHFGVSMPSQGVATMERMRRGQAIGPGRIDEEQIEIMTDAQVKRYLAEDGFEPNNPLGDLSPVLPIAVIRDKTGFSQEELAQALHIPVTMLQDWEHGRLTPDPAAIALFALVSDDPERAFEVLAR